MLGQRVLVRAARSSVLRRFFSDDGKKHGPPDFNKLCAVSDMRPVKATIAAMILAIIYQEFLVFRPMQYQAKVEPEFCLPVHKYRPPVSEHH